MATTTVQRPRAEETRNNSNKNNNNNNNNNNSNNNSSSRSSSSSSSVYSSSCSLQPLEDMTTCPIHLGRLEEPKLLGCSHAFCLTCLEKWERQHRVKRANGISISSSISISLPCPLCRSPSRLPPGGSRALPTAAAHQCVMAYIAGRRCKRAALATAAGASRGRQSRSRSLRHKQEVLVHLARDFAARSQVESIEFDRSELESARRSLSQLIDQLEAGEAKKRSQREKEEEVAAKKKEEEDEEEDEEDEEGEENEEEEEEEEEAWSTAAGGDSDVSDDSLNLCLVRRSMKRHCVYKLKEVDVDLQGVEIGDLGLVGEESQELVLLDEKSKSLLLYSTRCCRLRELPVVLRGRRVLCHHMQVCQGEIFISGKLYQSVNNTSSQQLCESVIVRLKSNGCVLGSCRRDADAEFAGLCVHDATGRLVVAQPSQQKVEFLTADLRSSGHWFTFDNLHPKYLAWSPERGILWASCPADGHILIVNDRTGVYRKLTTSRVCDSVPGHVTATSDRRIVFSDGSRIFWIVRRREFIFVQVLEHCNQLETVTGVAALPNDKILVSAGSRVFVLKPSRSLRRKRGSRCRLM